MTAVLGRLWPASLAGRVTLLLVLALAVAQLTLAVLLGTRQDMVVEGLMHSQALNQTVTLARLLNAYPGGSDGHLTDAFGSRDTCASVEASAPPARRMSAAERQLAENLTAMLHGIRAGAAQVAIGPIEGTTTNCHGNATIPYGGKHDHRGGDQAGDNFDRRAAVAMSVPLLDGRWLTMQTTVGVPNGFDRTTILSFVFSCLAVGVVAVAVIRHETRSLRALAAASERFGRGEQVDALPATGPSEIAAATRAFNTMQERLSLYLKDRLRLLASISHDLRTPLTTLRLRAEFIKDEPTRDAMIATIEELTTICEATLAFTHAEATSEQTQILHVSDLVGDVVDEFAMAGQPVSVGAISAIDCACRPVALKRALRNLVENAVRYGDGAVISVAAEARHAIISVDDTGPGLPPDRIEDAFEPFVRLEPSRSAETGGLGLGLAIARSIIRAHGGALELVSRPEGGLRARIELPCDQQSPGKRS